MSAKAGPPIDVASAANQPRPRFTPTASRPENTDFANSDEPGWIDVISAPCYFDIEVFFETLAELCLHPERNSTNILRADIVRDDQNKETRSETSSSDAHQANDIERDKYKYTAPAGYHRTRNIRRQILPRRPTRDAPLVQDCGFYRSRRNGDDEQGILVMIPHSDRSEDIPYYHPVLRKLAFRYSSIVLPAKPEPSAAEDIVAGPLPGQPQPQGTISISILPFPEEPASQPSTAAGGSTASGIATAGQRLSSDVLPNRTYRTCLHLLETLHKHGWGRLTGYQKRVIHDVIVEKTSFQDLYLILKERHKHLDSRVKKVRSNILEDLKRHVWKDVAVACFLMLLWRDMYPKRDVSQDANISPETLEDKPWLEWGRPQGGFLDLGCGNGLLVHILVTEGYHGKGLELRSRKTWPNYPQQTQDALVEMPINPEKWFPTSLEEWCTGSWAGKEKCPIVDGSFLIGNHADEMTPWIPLLSLLPSTPVPYLSLPCCLHALNAPFTLTKFVPPFEHPSAPADGFSQGLDEGESRYKTYLMWLGWSGLMSGWKWEKEGMRVPSTKGWGIIARSRWATTSKEDAACREWAFEQVSQVRKTGGFSVREKEGNPH